MALRFITKKARGTLWIVLIAIVGVSSSSLAQVKIATLNLKKVFDSYYKTKQADALLQDQGADADKVLKGWLDDYQKANAEYKKLIEGANDQAVSADERAKRKKAAEAKVVEISSFEKSINQFKKEATTRIDEQKRRMREKILTELREKINEKAIAGGYTHVLDTGAEGTTLTPILLYTDGKNDLTEELIAKINENAPPGILNSGAGATSPVTNPPELDSGNKRN
ncbi:MAG: OmpH family outer membrane protein [Verrucomicrobia bacterium]|nr:OmpH family outer membrane protein [Verrucomicrobiota bacterium]